RVASAGGGGGNHTMCINSIPKSLDGLPFSGTVIIKQLSTTELNLKVVIAGSRDLNSPTETKTLDIGFLSPPGIGMQPQETLAQISATKLQQGFFQYLGSTNMCADSLGRNIFLTRGIAILTGIGAVGSPYTLEGVTYRNVLVQGVVVPMKNLTHRTIF